MKKTYLYACLAAAMLLATACHDDDPAGPGFAFGDGKLHFAVGTNDKWTPETRASECRVDFINIDETMDGDPLLVVVEDNLTGDTISQQQPVTRGQRYTSDEDDATADKDYRKWDGTSGTQHRMQPSFALMGLKYSGDFDFSTSTVWTDLGDEIGTEFQTEYCVLTRPTSPEIDDDNYELWDWDSSGKGETNWPAEGDVFLFACAPAQTEMDYGIRFKATDGAAPYIDYTVPDNAVYQQDIMIAKRKMLRADIDKTTAGNPSNPTIKLDFQHICTAVKFRVAGDNTDSGNANLRIKRITLKNVVSQARFTFDATETEHTTTALAGTWTPGSERADMTYDFGEDGEQWTDGDKKSTEKTITTDDNVFMMIPQDFTAKDGDTPLQVNITCVQSDDTEFTLTVVIPKAHTWRAGHTVVYTIAKVGAVTIDAPTFNVTAVQDNESDLSTTADPNYKGLTDGNYVYTWDGTENITFKVESYRHYKIAGAHSGDMPIPWSITKTEMEVSGGTAEMEVSGGTGKLTYLNYDLPDMISMDTKTDTVVFNNVTGLYETIKKNKMWGAGGTSDTIHSNIHFPSRRGRTSSRTEAIDKVLDRNPYGTKESPQDLSMLGLDGVPTNTRNTANCYVVSAPGYYSIPLVFGNAIMGGMKNEDAYKISGVPHDDVTNSLEVFVDSKGNAISDPWIPYPASDAYVLWQTSEDLVTDCKVETLDDPVSGESHQFLNFAITPENINLGNAVIAVADDSGILWSWHIWVNDYSEVNHVINITKEEAGGGPYDFMQVNLGWTDGYTEILKDSICTLTFTQEGTSTPKEIKIKREGGNRVVSGTGGTYYQHGRKDPFPSVSVSKRDTIIWPEGNGVGSSVTVKIAEDMMFPEKGHKFLFYPESGKQVKVTKANKSMVYGIAHPNELILPSTSGKTNWFTSLNGSGSVDYYDNLWSMSPYKMPANGTGDGMHAGVYKTVYDPCPVGYCVPNPGAFMAFYTVEEYTYEDDYITVHKDATPNTTLQLSDFDVYADEHTVSTAIGFLTTSSVINAVKGDLVKYKKYTIDRFNTSGQVIGDGDSWLDKGFWTRYNYIQSKDKFAHGKDNLFVWKGTSYDSKYDGVEGLLYDGRLFFPSAGARNPDKGGKTEQGKYPTFNYGGYYATAYAAPSSNMAATFFWIQRKRLHEGRRTDSTDGIIIPTAKVPLFNPYNCKHTDLQEVHDIFIWRKASFIGTDYWDAANIYGVSNTNIGVTPKCVKKADPNRRVVVHFHTKWGPQPYTADSWGKERTYGLSVRPIKDTNFKTDVGIAVISNTGGTPYRDARSRKRR